MSLLAHAVRRTLGALLVLLVVLWLIQFAVWQIADSPTFNGRGGPTTLPSFAYSSLRFQPDAANEWRAFGAEVGLGLLAILGFGAAWRMRSGKAR